MNKLSLVILATLLAAIPAKGDIVTSSVSHTIGFNGAYPTSFTLDIDQNGTIDFNFSIQNGIDAVVTGTGTNAWLNDPSNNQPRPYSTYEQPGSNPYSSAGASGNLEANFGQFGYKFLMVRFTRNGANHYAWLTISVQTDGSGLTLSGLGWEQYPNTPVYAAQLGTSTNSVGSAQSSDDAPYCTATNHGIQVVGVEGIRAMSLSIANAAGQIVHHGKLSRDGFIPLDVPAGQYYGTLISDDKSFRKTFMLTMQ